MTQIGFEIARCLGRIQDFTTPRFPKYHHYGPLVGIQLQRAVYLANKPALRALGTPLAWPEAKKSAGQVREWGIEVRRLPQLKASKLISL